MSVTICEITRNILSTLEKEGLYAAIKGAEGVGTSHLSAGLIYGGESFNRGYGAAPSYSVAAFSLELTLSRDGAERSLFELQQWVHRLRDAITVDALNGGTLSDIRPVVSVWVEDIRVEQAGQGVRLRCNLSVRYRLNP